MGAANSKTKPAAPSSDTKKPVPVSVVSRVNKIAARYIVNGISDFYRFKDPDYCSKLVILTADALQKQLNSFELTSIDSAQDTGGAPVYVTQEDRVQRIGLRSSKEKRDICRKIARFYVQIAHVFAAIQAAVAPEDRESRDYYADSRYERSTRQDIKSSLARSACARRLAALAPLGDPSGSTVTINPKNICRINRPESRDSLGRTGASADSAHATLARELSPGFKKLEALYLDKWDDDAAKFVDKTAKMVSAYEKDVSSFYKAFTGGDPPTDDQGNALIKTFSSIPLKPYRSTPECMRMEEIQGLNCDNRGANAEACEQARGCRWRPRLGNTGRCVLGNAGLYRLGNISGSRSNQLFSAYGKHYAQMLKKSEAIKQSLNGVLDQLFTDYDSPTLTSKDRITLQPDLTRVKLAKIVEQTRGILTKLYLTCETDFRKGVELLDKIIDYRSEELRQRRAEVLNSAEYRALAGERTAMPAQLRLRDQIGEQAAAVAREAELGGD